MFNKKGGALNVWTYMLVIFLVVIFVYIMTHIGSFLTSPNVALSSASQEYYGNISGKSVNNITAMVDSGNQSDNKDSAWSFALSFLRLDKKVNAIKDKINVVTGFPSFLLYDVLKIPSGGEEMQFMVETITNFIGWAIGLALLYLLWK